MSSEQKPEMSAPFPITPVPPEVMEEARRNFNLEEWMAGIEEIERTGGLELKDFIHELEEAAAKHERPK